MPKTTDKTATRRKFLATAGVAGGAAVASSFAMPNVARAAPTVLKMQAAWGGGIFLENAKSLSTACTRWPART